jgi:presenilin-like A22 family membrane protease
MGIGIVTLCAISWWGQLSIWHCCSVYDTRHKVAMLRLDAPAPHPYDVALVEGIVDAT